MIDKIKFIPQNKNTEIEHLVVAIKKISSNQNHLLVIFKNRKEVLEVLHLGFNEEPILEELSDSHEYFWMNMASDSHNNIILKQYIYKFIKRSMKTTINYGISSNGTTFMPNGDIKQESIYDGLTCATFILKLFEGAGYKLFEYDTWKSRKEDIEWQENDVFKWISLLGTKEQLEYQKKLLSAHRFKPQEVMAAIGTDLKQLPLSFSDAVSIGKSIDNFLLGIPRRITI